MNNKLYSTGTSASNLSYSTHHIPFIQQCRSQHCCANPINKDFHLYQPAFSLLTMYITFIGSKRVDLPVQEPPLTVTLIVRGCCVVHLAIPVAYQLGFQFFTTLNHIQSPIPVTMPDSTFGSTPIAAYCLSVLECTTHGILY